MSPKQEAILHMQMAAEKIAAAGHAAYWFNSYGHEGADYQLKIMGEEFAKMSAAWERLNAAHADLPVANDVEAA